MTNQTYLARAIAVCLAMFFVASAAAMTFSRLPRPITFTDLDRYGDRLGLSMQQRHLLDAELEQYRGEFAELRDEMIEVAIRYPRMRRSDEFIRHIPGFVRRTQALDDEFFHAIKPILTESQQASLPQVQMMRERSLYAQLDLVGQFIGNAVPDLTELLADIDTPADVLESIQPTLVEYEQRLTQSIHGIFGGAIPLCTMEDERSVEMMIERVRALRAMNLRSYRQIAEQLPESLQQTFHHAFYVRAYRNVYDTGMYDVIPKARAALQISDLNESTHHALQDIVDEALVLEQNILERLMVVADEDAIVPAPLGGAVGSSAYLEAINDARRERSDAEREMVERMKRLLGDRYETVSDIRSERVHSSGGWRYVCGVVTNAAAPPRTVRARTSRSHSPWEADVLLARPIAQQQWETYMLLLDTPSQLRPQLDAMYQDYRRAIEEKYEDRRRDLNQFIAHLGHDSTGQRDPEARARRRDELRDMLRAKVERADAELFAAVYVLLNVDEHDERVKRVQWLRDRRFIQMKFLRRGGAHPNRAAEVDLIELVARLDVSPHDWHALNDVAVAYEASLVPLLRDRFTQLRKYEYDALTRRDGGRRMMTSDESQAFSALRKSIHDLHRDIAALNQKHVDHFANALDADAAARLHKLFARLAYPEAFEDPGSMADALRAASSLRDLLPEQRDRLSDIQATFATRYESARYELIAASAAYTPHMPGPGRTVDVYMEERFEQADAKWRDEFAAINHLARRELRSVLHPDQLQQLHIPHPE